MYLIVGLGNPGPEYEDTRHNVGFRVIDRLGRVLGVRLKGRGFQSRIARIEREGRDLLLLSPATFMNLSGSAVKRCADYYGVALERLLVVHDDLDLPVGRVKVVRNGGAGGHKGVASVIQHLGDEKFVRVKVGIGRPRHGEAIEDFVLSPFYDDQKDVVERVIQLAVRACELLVEEGVESAMNHINSQNLKEVKD